MSNAVDRARKLHADLARLKGRKSEQHESEHFEKRRDELRAVRIKLEAAVVPFLVLARRGRIEADAVPSTVKLQAYLAEVTRRAREEAPNAITRGQDYARLHDSASKLAVTVAGVVEEAWGAFRAELPAVNAVPLGEIALIPGQAGVVDSVRQLDEAVRKASQKPPVTEAEYDALIEQIEALRARLDQLSEKSFPPAVRRFILEALRPWGADRALLTPEVLDWLTTRNLTDRVRLRFIEELPAAKPASPPRGGKK